MDNIEEMAARVDAHPDYRVLRYYLQPKEYQPEDGAKKSIGLFIDTETTGLSSAHDRIIELGMVRFSYARATGLIYQILDVFAQFEDPGRPIPANIIALTGITDEMVRGLRIDDAAVSELTMRSNLIIAHNAAFDRAFMENRFPIFKTQPWACSINDVPWQAEGIRSRSLEYLAYHYGFFYKGHRGAVDCLVALHILAQRLPHSRRPVLKVLLENARCKSWRIWAISAPYDKKDVLKARGYRWSPGDNGRPKAWYKNLDRDVNLDDERLYLTSVINCPEAKLRVDEVDAFSRYSEREESS